MLAGKTQDVRRRLLAIHGIGPETADCILLYAGEHPIFVVDAYTRRIFARLGSLGRKVWVTMRCRRIFTLTFLPTSPCITNTTR